MANEHSNTPTPEQAHIIPLSKIHEMPGVFNSKPVDSKLGSMVLSIQSSGIKEPVIVRDRGDGHYQLLSGYRRRRASELAKKEDIPAFVYEMTVQEAISYRRAVKDNPKAPIPGKLVEPEAVKGRDAEKPTEAVKDAAEKGAAAKNTDKPDAPEKEQPSTDKSKGAEKPAETVKGTAEKDAAAKSEGKSGAPEKEQPSTDKSKDTEKPAEAVKDAAEKDAAAKGGDKPDAPEKEQPDTDKGKDAEKPAEAVKDAAEKGATAKGEDKPDAPEKEQPSTDKGKDAEKPDETAKADAEKSGEAEHLPTVAELEAQAKAGKVVNISDIIAAQQREREAKKDAPATAKEQKHDTGKGTPKSTLRPTESEAEKMKKSVVEQKADAQALETAVKGNASTAISQVLEDRLDPPTEESLKSIPAPGDGESIFVTLHPAYLEKSPLNTFSVDTESENFKELCKSIELVGIKDPVLARFNEAGELEILSGQRRHLAATMLNRAVPTIIQKIDDADAKILVADGNLHRDKISSYDLSRALRMKMEGMKQKAGRRKKGYSAAELQSDARLAQEMGMSIPKLNRIIHLSEAVKGVCDLVDDGKLTISVASEIAYLKKSTQESVLHLLDLGYKATNDRITRIKKAEIGGEKMDDIALRSILDDKDLAPKQQPQPQAQASAPAPSQQPASPAQPQTPAPGTTVQPAQSEAPTQTASAAPAPETIPASPDVAPQTPTGMSAPTSAEQSAMSKAPDAPTKTPATPTGQKSEKEDDPFKGEQERPEETKIVLRGDRLRKYFPDVSMTPREIEDSIYSALEERRQRQLHQQQRPNLLKR